jgi:hypothetical protein
MKRLVVRYSLCLLVMVVGLAGAVYWRRETYNGNPVTVLLMWPTTLLAIHGVAPSWPASVILLLALPAMAASSLRSKPLIVSAIATVLMSLAFCYVGSWQTRRLTKTEPLTNPYPSGSTSAAAYVEGYGEGYAYAVTGTWATYCFRPEDATSGFYQGQDDGRAIFNRSFGLPANNGRNLIKRSAELDGVRSLTPTR